MRRLTMVELNEFNRELLEQAAAQMDVPSIGRVLELRRTSTRTDDVYQDGSLEPWVQWVSIHTGVPYGAHGVLHIGDLPDEGLPQIWETLSDRGVSSGVWGVLNGARRRADNCHFFVPDPWTFHERAHPESLHGLIALPRFLAKNRLHVVQGRLLRHGARLALAFANPRRLVGAMQQLPTILKMATRDPARAYVYFSAFEYLAAKRFAEMKRRHDPSFSVLFLNLLAHAQHYYWSPLDLSNNARMRYVLKYVDLALAEVFSALRDDEQLVVLNGFEQVNIAHDEPHHVYRQRDHLRFLRERLDVTPVSVDAHMTNDAHLIFETEGELERAVAALSSARVNGEPLFELQRYAEHRTKLFFRVCYGRPLPPNSDYQIEGRTFRFWDDFESLGTHTGRHAPSGTVYSTLPDIPDRVANHEVLKTISAYFGVPSWPVVPPAA